jgi:hypothetical protein
MMTSCAEKMGDLSADRLINSHFSHDVGVMAQKYGSRFALTLGFLMLA